MNYSDIVPEVLQQELMRIGDLQDQSCWRLGDICLQVFEYCTRNSKPVSKMDVYKAVSTFSGKQSRTVREFATMAKFYAPEVREIYGVLRIDHFRTAMALDDKWEEALNWCVSRVDTLGRPATVDSMQAHFFGDMIEQVDNYISNLPGNDHEDIGNENRTPVEVAYAVVNKTLYNIRELRKMIESGSLPDDGNLTALIDTIEGVLISLKSEV
jgi:hypothetical protein